ncbi:MULTISPECIES: hypothetical protein [Helcococcus]|uniref:DNA ligase n=1 Tax=Helcococcus bovis TaxID=3153252 RepID=A0ABW9F5C1_9FIRM
MAKIKQLKEIHESLTEIVDDLGNLLYREDDKETKNEEEIDIETLRGILAEKSRAGFTKDIKELLSKYGSDKLSQVDPMNYKNLIKDVEELK